VRIQEIGPDDDRFAAWCEVWSAGCRLDRPDDPPRPAGDHVALGRQLVTPGGSREALTGRRWSTAPSSVLRG
jgi:hypothetical protein